MQNINGLRVVAGGSWVDQYTFKASTLVIEGGYNLQASKRLQPFNQRPTSRKQASKCLQASALQPASSDQEASSRPKQMGVATSGRRPGTRSKQPARKQANGSGGWGGERTERRVARKWPSGNLYMGPSS
jgi:hypothetical protein